MKKNLLLLVISGLILSGVSVKAAEHTSGCGYRCDYPETIPTVIDQHVDKINRACYLVPLKLERTPDGDLTVDSWVGGYATDATVTTTYRIDHYDPCTGDWLGSENTKFTGPETFTFNVDNPNLDGGNDVPSYVSNAPMTGVEAQAALPAALNQCLKDTPIKKK
jgi:hypothetical protein